MSDGDFMEFGDSDLVPIDGGWFLNKKTKEKIDPNGRVFDQFGELIFDPKELDDFGGSILDDEYEWWNDPKEK